MSGVADPGTFPYSPVLREFHRVGKHFVKPDLLAQLDHVRARVTVPDPTPAGGPDPARLLRDFLDVALDKWDGRYDYRSYLALRLLGLPVDTDDLPDRAAPGDAARDDPPGRDAADRDPAADAEPPLDPAGSRRRHDLLLVRLIADALAFEVAAGVGSDLLPHQRPPAEVVAKRHRLGLRAVAPALARLGLAGEVDGRDPAEAATALHARALREDPDAARVLRLSMLPVYLSHDEYLFIRVLQGYECVFAQIAGELHATQGDLAAGRASRAAQRLAHARDQLTTAGPLFSLLATMQPAAFRTFREYTDGASAIQSRSYKLMESLCRVPERQRLDSAAYRSVPEVRDRVLVGHPSIDGAYRSAVHEGRLAGSDRSLVESGMDAFATAVLQWRRTHYRLAVRMLGTRPGTGYTEGTPYLAQVRAIPVFTARPDPADPPPADDPAARCPGGGSTTGAAHPASPTWTHPTGGCPA
ncbi:tryptophan 2,3-dioxygenase family protein [Micromonospora rosaria]|uniref:tryptophan 2,3-dioxygenase family protein n=1 Tax=Micromonospora rosaria TaxID=47874 RepID=UPI0008345EB2